MSISIIMVTELPPKLPPSLPLALALDSAKMITMTMMMASTTTAINAPITPPAIAPTLAPAESTMAAQKNVFYGNSIVSTNPLFVIYTSIKKLHVQL